MNRIQLALAALLGALFPLVFDSALKGAVLLAAAALCALMLYAASAATRHLVWLVTVVALLIVPVLSFALPQWRILPQWTASPLADAAVTPAATMVQMTQGPHRTQGPPHSLPPSASPAPAITAPESAGPGSQALSTSMPQTASPIPQPARTWRDWLPLAWAAGFAFLALRLLAAHLLLRRAARNCTALTDPPDGFIVAAFTAACAQLGIRQRVTLLLDEKRTIPVVWGVFRPRLLLPVEAREWNEEQLRSVLLHELAHIRRRDTLVQWLTQVACALHWWNPLVWLAAWRLHIERERACDDLVLASGVRPSTYAEHLLNVATKLSPACWTSACGLAMTRKSSLEGRLLAVLSEKLNRRSVTRILVAAAVILAAAVAIPLAMLRAAGPDKSKADAPAVSAEPKDQKSKALFEKWKARARSDGKIPGGLIGRLGAKVEEFVRINRDDASGAPHAKKVEPILPRFDASHDWSPDEAVALLNDLAALSDIPIRTTLETDDESRLHPGEPLPAGLKNAPWGEPSPEGLRVARPLDPGGDSYPMGMALRSRILLHNVGRQPVLLRTKSWMQPGYEARDATGAAVKVESTYWTTFGQIRTSRLAPGEYMEILTPGLGVGKGAGNDGWADVRVGSWLEATGAADITLSPGAVSVSVDDSRGSHIKNGEQLKREIIRERLDRESPMPASAADREKIVRRVTKDIFGVDPTADEIAAFVSSKSNDPISALANRLLERAGLASFVGEVKPGEIKFRVTPADPDAANRPKVAIGAGRYTIGDNARLIIQGGGADAEIQFWAADQKSEPPGKPHKIEIPGGFGTWAITCRPAAGILYVLTKGAVRKVDFSNPAQVKETPVTRGSAEDMPDEFREAVKRILTISGVPAEQITALLARTAARGEPRNGETLPEGTEAQLDWGEAVNGLRGAVVVRSKEPGGPPGVFLAVQNVSAAAMRFSDTMPSERLRTLYLSDSKGILMGLGSGEPTQTDVLLQPREVAFLAMFPPVKDPNKRSVEPALIEGVRKDSLQTWKVVLQIEKAPEGAWKGKLITAETRGAIGTEGPQPKSKGARSLFKLWQANARLNGNIPGGLLNRLHDKVKEFIRANTGDASGDPYAKKMVPLEPRFGVAGDWNPADVVALLDDIAAVTTIPLETTMDHLTLHTLRPGQPLPAALEKADWGEPLEGGLRMAYVLEPRAAEYHLGTEVKARIILHNSGNEPVAFIGFNAGSLIQSGHKARLADGSELKIDYTWGTGSAFPQAYRLAPGEYIELHTPGLGIGPQDKRRDVWSEERANSWIRCGPGDEITLQTVGIMLSSQETEEIGADWWLNFINERLSREAPVPLDTKEREYLLYRVVRDIFGTAPSTTEGDAFAADKSPDALKNLAALLAKHPYGKQCQGMIQPGETKFRVLPPDPDAAKKPRVAMNPGRYKLSDEVRLVVTRRRQGARILNDGSVTYHPPGKDILSHDLKLPDGNDTWAAGLAPGTSVLWVTQKGLLRKIDFTDPAKLEETRYEGDKTAGAPIPAGIREALRAALDVPDAPKQVQKPLNPPPATLKQEPEPEEQQPKQGAKTDETKEPPADPNAAKAPRTASAPGKNMLGKVAAAEGDYDLGDGAQLQVERPVGRDGKPVGTMMAHLSFESAALPGSTIETDFTPHFISIGDGPFRFVWERGASVLWLVKQGIITKFDFTNRAQVKEETIAPERTNGLPEAVKEARVFPDGEAQEPAQTESPDGNLPKGAQAKITPEALLGFWKGSQNGEAINISFHRPPADAEVQCDIYFGEATIGALMTFTIAPDGKSVTLVGLGKGSGEYGRLTPREGGTLQLEVTDKRAGPGEVTLTRDVDEPATEPGQKEARELFAMWKITANDDGTIPGTFIGMFAAEVRAYVKANPNLDSGMKLPKLLPRFVTSRDWTQAEAIKLLDDVAYYATEPIEARVAKAKLPSGALWRTMAPFEDIPVAIAKWSEAKDGLRIGMRVVEGDWRIGGKVRMELWLHNAGENDVSFKTTGPDRQDTGVAVSAVGADGREHWAENGNVSLIAIPLHATLPAGHVAKAKDVTLSFDAPDNKELAWFTPKFRELAPGKYKLRCLWSDPHPSVSNAGDWTGALAAPELEFTLVAQDAPKTVAERKLPPVDGPPVHPRLTDDRYAKSGVPLAEQTWPMPPWGAEKNGLSAGIRVIGDARIGGEVKVELWVRNSSPKDVKFSQNPRADVGLSVVAKDKDGKEHSADITRFSAYPIFHHWLLPPGHGVKVKEFKVKFGAGKNDKLERAWVNLQLAPGDYKLHAKWSDSHALVTHADDWTGQLTSGEVDLRISAADAPRNPGAAADDVRKPGSDSSNK